MPLQSIAIRMILLAAALICAGCGSSDSPEQQVRTVLEQMETAAEARDVGELMEHISEDYRDSNGLGPQEAARYVRGYFIANQSIHLLTRVEDITFPIADEARAKVLVGMVGREAATTNDSSDWGDLAADIYQFEITFRREDEQWKVSFARWLRK